MDEKFPKGQEIRMLVPLHRWAEIMFFLRAGKIDGRLREFHNVPGGTKEFSIQCLSHTPSKVQREMYDFNKGNWRRFMLYAAQKTEGIDRKYTVGISLEQANAIYEMYPWFVSECLTRRDQ